MKTYKMDERLYLALLRQDGAHWSAEPEAVARAKSIQYYLEGGEIIVYE